MNYKTTATNKQTKNRCVLVRMDNEYVNGERKELFVSYAEMKNLSSFGVINPNSTRLTREESCKSVEDFESKHHLADYDNSALHICDKECCKKQAKHYADLRAKGISHKVIKKNEYGDYVITEFVA